MADSLLLEEVTSPLKREYNIQTVIDTVHIVTMDIIHTELLGFVLTAW